MNFVPPHSKNHPPGACSKCDAEIEAWKRQEALRLAPQAENGRSIFRTVHKANFTVLPNSLLRDSKLSFKARGIAAMLLSNQEDWNVYAGWIESQGTEGREAVAVGMRELEQAGYIVFALAPRTSGRFTGGTWLVYDVPVPAGERTNKTKWDQPGDGSPSHGKPSHGKPGDGFPATKKYQGEEEPSTEVQSKEEEGDHAPLDPVLPLPSAPTVKDSKLSEPELPLQAPEKLPDFPAASMLAIWNEAVPGSKIQGIAGQRKNLARARWKQLGSTKKAWSEFCQKVGTSPFLTGKESSRSKRTFTASFDWAIMPGNFVKIQEGKYDPKSNSKSESEKHEW